MVEKYGFLKEVKIPYPKNRFLVSLSSIFSTYKLFLGRGYFFSVSTFNEEYVNEKMSSLAGLKKIYPIFCQSQSTDFDHFLLPESTFKVDFLKVQAKFQKILGQFPWG